MLTQAIRPSRGDTPAVATLAASYSVNRQGNAVAEEGSPTPRRALGPLPEEPGESPAGGRYGRAFMPDEPSPLTSTGRLRRLAVSPASPVDPLEVQGSTPVPPPAPVLPEPEAALPASAGRRFSASAEPDEFVSSAPRRSAVSPASPTSAGESILPSAPRPSTPPKFPAGRFTPSPYAPSPAASPIEDRSATASASDATSVESYPRSVPTAPTLPPTAPTFSAPSVVAGAAPGSDAAAAVTAELAQPASAEPTTETVAEAAPKKRGRRKKDTADTNTPESVPEEKTPREKKKSERSSRPALIIIASVAAVALVVAAGVWLLTLRSGASSGAPTNGVTTSALDPLVTVADLGTLGGASWVESTGTSDAARPLCLPATSAGLPDALRSVSRKTGASSSDVDSLVQVVDTYADDATATQAYAVRLAQAGTCNNDVVWITGANSVTGLADSADAVRLVDQEQANVFHTLLLSRTGRTVSLVDLATGKGAVNALDLADVVGKALSRQCGGDLGTCPASIGVATVPPPAGDPKGWLVEADLPRITAGSGRWGATDPVASLQVLGSQCEGVNLQTVSGTQSVGQRTLLLGDDGAAPKGFGVDMAVYTFGTESAASALADKISGNISKCADRAPTATVKDGPDAKGAGESDAKIAGTTFLVTHKTETTSVLYRVAVMTVGSKVVYLLGNPSTSFDFTDAQWKAIAVRAGQRATQA